jgi:hypothetical protein
MTVLLCSMLCYAILYAPFSMFYALYLPIFSICLIQIFDSWSDASPCIVDTDILATARARVSSEAHWLHSKLVLNNEVVVALSYVIIVIAEKSLIQQVEPEVFMNSLEFKCAVKEKAAKITEFIEDLDTKLCKDLALKFVQSISSNQATFQPARAASEPSDRKCLVVLRNFFTEASSNRREKAVQEIKNLFAIVSRCVHVSKVDDCSSCVSSRCGCFVLSFESDQQVAKCLQSAKVLHKNHGKVCICICEFIFVNLSLML